MDRLFEKSRAKISEVATDYVRNVHDEIAWDDRMVAIVGARGVGKTTLLLQHIKLYDNLRSVISLGCGTSIIVLIQPVFTSCLNITRSAIIRQALR